MNDEHGAQGRYPGATSPYPVPSQPVPAQPAGGFPPYGPPPQAPFAPAPQRPQRQPRVLTTVTVAAVVSALVGGGAGFGAYALLDDGTPGTQLVTSPSTPVAAAEPGTVAGAAAIATPSTVDIQVLLAQGAAEGSGVILSADGAVLTNNHVVAGSTGEITVTLADGTEHPATVVGTAPSYDLAVLQLQGVSGLTPAVLGNDEDLQVGQQVVAIGSPRGLSGTVTTGIISAFDRTVTVPGDDGSAVVYNGLQTDTPINQGNSGGPLVDLQGRVVGINSAIQTTGSEAGSIGLGFAIPVDQAERIAQEILDTGTATKPVLGVQGNAASGPGDGAEIGAVTGGSPAASGGLVAGDVVTRVDDRRVQDFADLIASVGSYAPGDRVTLTLGDGRTVEVTLGSTPDEAASTSSGGQTQQPPNPFGFPGGNPFGGGN